MSERLAKGFWVLPANRRRATAVLAAILLVLLAVLAANAWLHEARRQVEVILRVIEDEQYVYVNCERAGVMRAENLGPGDPPVTVELGWLEPDDVITFAYVNSTGTSVTPNFAATSNEREFNLRLGSEAIAYPGLNAPEGTYGIVRSYTADGDLIGNTGCQRPGQVAHGAYAPLTDASHGEGGGHQFAALRDWDPIPDLAHIASLVVIVIGFFFALPIITLEARRKRLAPLALIAFIGGFITALQLIAAHATPFEVLFWVGLYLYLVSLYAYARGRRSKPFSEAQ